MKRLAHLLPLFALAVLAGGCGTKTETSTAAVEVRRADPSNPYDPTGAKQPFDPIFLRSQFDVVCSDSILSAVVQSNDLGRVLDAAFGRTPSSKAESDELAVLYLRQHVECRLIRDSPLIIIDVSVERSVPDAKRIAPKLATDIAQAYQAHSRSLRDKAQQATADALRSEIESLEKAIEAGGTTIRSYTSSLGVTGRFQNELYCHTMKNCKICGSDILKIRVGGRGTYYCPKCQK